MNEAPVAVYKYLTFERTASVLKDLQIRFSQASVLNDATELKPPLKGIATESDLKRVLTERVRRDYAHVVKHVEESLPADRSNAAHRRGYGRSGCSRRSKLLPKRAEIV